MKSPTAIDLIRIKQAQHRMLNQLNSKAYWTNKDFEEVFYCYHQWIPEQKEWYVPYSALRELAFDARTPNEKAKTLQQLIGQFDQLQKPNNEPTV